jgi:hypothetical protein
MRMDRHRGRRLLVAGLLGASLFAVLHVPARARFVFGGALVNAGFRLQDDIDDFALSDEHHAHAPGDIWNELVRQNHWAASIRKRFPRSSRHPLVAMVVCMDARLDTAEVAGDTRKFYYVVRTAGSVLGEHEEDMLELAVANGVRVIVLTTHTDCAAEKIARDPARRDAYPHLVAAIDERERRIEEFLARPAIREKIARGDLLVKRVDLDTPTDELQPR